MSRKEPNISQKKPLKGINFKIIQAQGLIKTSFIVGCNTINSTVVQRPQALYPSYLSEVVVRKETSAVPDDTHVWKKPHTSQKKHLEKN